MAEASRDKALAGRIRAGGSDTYDLAGYSPLQAGELMQAAFGAPIEVSEMMKVTLVVGGGKKVRTAYGGTEGLVRDVCSALEKLGFADDRGASCTLECQGSFKYQHDTDKDLKFVHVFPRVDTSASAAAAAASAAEADAGTAASTPESQCITCTLEALQKLVPRRVASFMQKKALLAHLKATAATCAGVEAKLAALEAPTPEEQATYDAAVALPDKLTWLAAAMEAQIDAGQLTKAEQEAVLAQLAAKVEEAERGAAAARAEGKDARAAKLDAARATLASKRTAVAALKPISHPVKFEKELRQLRAQLVELEKIEACRGLQPLETVKKLREKPNIEASIRNIEDANRGWFEDPEAFAKRMRTASKPLVTAAKPAGAAGGVAGGGGSAGGFAVQRGAPAKAAKPAGKVSSTNPWSLLGE